MPRFSTLDTGEKKPERRFWLIDLGDNFDNEVKTASNYGLVLAQCSSMYSGHTFT